MLKLDGTLKLLLAYNIPITRESYLELAFAGKPPEELDEETAEHLVEIGVSNIMPDSATKNRAYAKPSYPRGTEPCSGCWRSPTAGNSKGVRGACSDCDEAVWRCLSVRRGGDHIRRTDILHRRYFLKGRHKLAEGSFTLAIAAQQDTSDDGALFSEESVL